MSRRTPLLFTISAVLILTAMGLCFAGGMTATHPPNWVEAAGRIDSARAVPICGPTRKYAPMAVYSFAARGVTWHGASTNGRRPPCVSEDSAAAIAKRIFPPSRLIVVYYNPKEPDMSLMVLEAPSRGHPYAALIAVLALVVVIATVRSFRGT